MERPIMLLTKKEKQIIQQLANFQTDYSEPYKLNALNANFRELYDLANYLLSAEYAAGVSRGDASMRNHAINNEKTIVEIRRLLPKAQKLLNNLSK